MIASCALLLLAAGCKDKNTPEEQTPAKPAEQSTQGNVEDPKWVVTVENDLTSSMTAVVKVTVSDQPGTLAAFMGDACCGVATFNDEVGLYWLYMSPATEAGGDVQLRFYSPEFKHIYNAKETFPFRNDDVDLGNVSTPYTPEWVVSE